MEVHGEVRPEELTSCHCQHVPQSAAGLHLTTIGVDVNVPDGLLDPNAEAQGFSGVGVQNVHKVGVIRRQSVLFLHTFKHWAGRIET